ncbi:hypothetical protein MMC25_001846 [Agyrium rufum]|nr:hypothetical protein [Agyrium rufum]
MTDLSVLNNPVTSLGLSNSTTPSTSAPPSPQRPAYRQPTLAGRVQDKDTRDLPDIPTSDDPASHVPVIHKPGTSEPQSQVNKLSNNGVDKVVAGSTADQGSRQNRHSLASIARDKTTTVLSNLTTRTKSSATSLHTAYQSGGRRSSSNSSDDPDPPKPLTTSLRPPRAQRSHTGGLISPPDYRSRSRSDFDVPRATLDLSSTDRRRLLDRSPSPSPSRVGDKAQPGLQNKMHQTSSRLLRMTDEERPFTRDFKDLFATLVVSLPLTAHRVRFQKVEHTFTSEEAINNLGSLKFSQSNRMPDPKDPSRIVTTTTTTTFSMAKEMARSVCQRFMDARFIESADGKAIGGFPLKGAVWQLTPKGMHVLTRFCQRNGINQRHVLDVLDSPRNTMQLVIMERDVVTDKLSHDRATVEVIFRRFAGQDGPNLKSSISSSDSDSVSDYHNGLIGVKMAKERKIGDRSVHNTFTGKAAVDWLMDCCTTVDRRECDEIADSFVQNELISPVLEDRSYIAHNQNNPTAARFQPTRNAIYILTGKGRVLAGWIPRDTSTSNPRPNDKSAQAATRAHPRDSNNNRLWIIVDDPALRLLFREFLRDTHCEENLAFFMEVREFTKGYDTAEKAKVFTRLDAIRESLAQAYGLYNAFLAPGSPCELNIDHNLRNSLAGRMTRAVGDDESMLKSLQEVVTLFKEAQTSVFKLMSSDSVPKFLKEQKYANVLRHHDFDPAPNTTAGPERSMSKTTRDPRAT